MVQESGFREHSKDYWEDTHSPAFWGLPSCAKPEGIPDLHRLFLKYVDVRGGSLFEVGCAPGRFLAYFAKYFDMKVSGIDYVPAGVDLTKRNMSMQGIDADVVLGDFFNADLAWSGYDVVFSGGFIEHFPETQEVVSRIVSLANANGGYVITVVPNFLGLNGWLRKKLAPHSYAGHLRFSPQGVRELHEKAGAQTLFCQFCGHPQVMFRADPAEGGDVAHSSQVKILEWTIRYLNVGTTLVWRKLRWVPRWRVFSPSIVYIGRRQ